MSLRINLNSAAASAARNLAGTDSNLSKSIERLSSGYKINRGADDPAGLVISEKLRAQVSGMAQAISNSQDAVNLIKTAEGALTESNSLLRGMRDLAVHAANLGANDSASVAADQVQINSAIQSLNNISNRTSFGNKKLLDGTASVGLGAIVGGGGAAGSNSDISSVTAASTNSAFMNATGDKAVTIHVTQDAAKAQSTGAATVAGGAQLSTAAGWTATTTSSIKVNGVDLGTFTAAQTGDDVINAINNNATLSQTVVATRNSVTNRIEITSKQYGSSQGITVEETMQDTGAAFPLAVNLIGTGSVDLLDHNPHTTTSVAWGKDIKGTVSGNGVGGGTVDFNSGSGFVMKDAAGDAITFSSGMTGKAASNATYTSTVTGSGTVFQLGAFADETASVSLASSAANALGTGASTVFASVANIDLTTNAQEAIKVLDAAISQMSTTRANLGAFQKNVLESNINSLGVAKENISASESAVRDTDMALEMTNFTRLNIMEQAGTAMLTQANQQPQQLLSLLKG
ncbi:MAG TPA: flagellin [Armatimonadota bacterium]|jgi:flagellin